MFIYIRNSNLAQEQGKSDSIVTEHVIEKENNRSEHSQIGSPSRRNIHEFARASVRYSGTFCERHDTHEIKRKHRARAATAASFASVRDCSREIFFRILPGRGRIARFPSNGTPDFPLPATQGCDSAVAYFQLYGNSVRREAKRQSPSDLQIASSRRTSNLTLTLAVSSPASRVNAINGDLSAQKQRPRTCCMVRVSLTCSTSRPYCDKRLLMHVCCINFCIFCSLRYLKDIRKTSVSDIGERRQSTQLELNRDVTDFARMRAIR